jgi:hypothetical protein
MGRTGFGLRPVDRAWLRMTNTTTKDGLCQTGGPQDRGKSFADETLERQRALVFQGKQCRSCHMIGGTNGRRGPVLDNVATRLPYD